MAWCHGSGAMCNRNRLTEAAGLAARHGRMAPPRRPLVWQRRRATPPVRPWRTCGSRRHGMCDATGCRTPPQVAKLRLADLQMVSQLRTQLTASSAQVVHLPPRPPPIMPGGGMVPRGPKSRPVPRPPPLPAPPGPPKLAARAITALRPPIGPPPPIRALCCRRRRTIESYGDSDEGNRFIPGICMCCQSQVARRAPTGRLFASRDGSIGEMIQDVQTDT